MVNLTRIYTRTGDTGTTHLADLTMTSKTDARVMAYGDVDEANSLLGVVITQPDLSPAMRTVLEQIQNELFDCGADLATPVVANPAVEPLRIVQPYVDRLEIWCDQFAETLVPLRSFVLPGGSQTTALLHLARSVVRRAERSAWAAAATYGTEPATGERPGGINPTALTYLNRLSDLLFIMARASAPSEVLWVPGKDRGVSDKPGKPQRRGAASGSPQRPPASS